MPTKDCAVCGRTITWRTAWERDWEQVRHCSDACRRRSRSAPAREVDAALDAALLRLLAGGGRAGAGVEDLARTVAAERGEEARDLAEPARSAARRLVAAGGAQIVQAGSVVDPSTARGPFTVRRR